MDKREARALARARRAALDLKAVGAAMAGQLFVRGDWRAAQTVLCFVSLCDEPDTMPILRRALAEGKRLCVPRVLDAGRMEWVVLTGLDRLVPRAYGILEPADGAVVTDFGPDPLALIPCLAAAPDGVRLGRGGGYYDRFLGQYNGKRLLLCPADLLFDTLPCDAWDAVFAPTEILTEKGTLQ